ncbi:MAG: serine hydrolase domain-containing protein [Heteroscytonema crispum UTEX LB 1556]
MRNQLAQGYAFKGNKFQNIDYLEILVTGAGSVFSSVNDMSKYVSALLNNGQNQFGRILKPETLQLMIQPQYQLDPRISAMGLTFFLDDLAGHKIVSHDGGWPGFVSSMQIIPDADLGIVVFTNTSALAPHSIAETLLQRLLEVPDTVSQLPRPDIVPSGHLWSQLCGYYAPKKGLNTNFRLWLSCGGGVEVFVKDNHLQMRSLIGFLQKPVTLYPVDATEALAFQGVKDKWKVSLIFKRNANDDIECMYLAGFYGFWTLYKRSQSQSPRFWLKAILAALAVFTLAIWREQGLLVTILAFLMWKILKINEIGRSQRQ